MSFFNALLHGFINHFHAIKTQNLNWQADNQERQLHLAHERIIAKKKLVADLAVKNAQLGHEITLLKTRQDAELAMLKKRCKEDVKDYQDYLKALSQLKQTIRASYAHLPDAIAHTIHHHAKTLLNAMWESENLDDKIKHEAQLIKFMMTLHEEARLCRTGTPAAALPEKTLQLIQQNGECALGVGDWE